MKARTEGSGRQAAELTGGEWQMNQLKLAFEVQHGGEAPKACAGGAEPSETRGGAQGPASNQQLMEEVCEAKNLTKALARVKANKGSPGVDGMTVGQLPGHLKKHWPEIRQRLLSGTYRPEPVRRVDIPKPDGGVRKLGIPTVLDRFVQQAVMQVLQEHWDASFSESSYGFRPGRSAHQAVTQAREYVAQGCRWVVDLDLEKFFDRVNHDMLMGRVARRVADKRALKLIRAFLNSGVMEAGLVSPTEEGTPQGGPLSPLLSNLMLDDLDRELERRGHRFARYADDCNIYVRSQRAAHRTMASIERYIVGKLKLKVNKDKSAVARASQRKFLGFSFTSHRRPKIRVARPAIERFKRRVRVLTGRMRGVGFEQVAKDLTPYIRGWGNYFGLCETPRVLEGLDGWVRRRLRALAWKQWQNGSRRYAQVRRLGVRPKTARSVTGNAGPWSMSLSLAMCAAMPESYFDRLGLPRLHARMT